MEFLAEQYGDETNGNGLLAVSVHPGAVLTEIADRTTPESFRKCESIPLFLNGDVGNANQWDCRSYRRC